MAAVRDKGVNFANPHSLFPTFTMANASGMSTGHFLGDTGVFSATRSMSDFPAAHAANSVTPFIESDPVLGDIDDHFSGNFVDEDAVLFAARHQGFSTAAIGKVGPTLMFDHIDRSGENTIIVDDATGSAAGIPLSQEMQGCVDQGGSAARRARRAAPTAMPATPRSRARSSPMSMQQKYFADVAAKVVLPMFKARNKPFVLVFWSRDPDGTQHNQGDSLLHGRRPASTARPRSPPSRTPTTIWRSCARRSTSSASPPRPTSSSPPITASRRSPRKARPAPPRRRATPTCRPACCRPALSPSISPRRSACRCTIPTTRTPPVAAGTYPKRGNGLIGTDAAQPGRGGRLQRRLRSRLCARQGPRAHRQGRRGAAGAGLCQRPVRRRRSRHDSPARCRCPRST